MTAMMNGCNECLEGSKVQLDGKGDLNSLHEVPIEAKDDPNASLVHVHEVNNTKEKEDHESSYVHVNGVSNGAIDAYACVITEERDKDYLVPDCEVVKSKNDLIENDGHEEVVERGSNVIKSVDVKFVDRKSDLIENSVKVEVGERESILTENSVNEEALERESNGPIVVERGSNEIKSVDVEVVDRKSDLIENSVKVEVGERESILTENSVNEEALERESDGPMNEKMERASEALDIHGPVQESAELYPNFGSCTNGSCSDARAIDVESVPNPKTSTCRLCIGTEYVNLESDPNPELSMNGSGIKIGTGNLDLGLNPEDVTLESDPNFKIIQSDVVILESDPSSGICNNGSCVEPETAIVGSDPNLEMCTDELCLKTDDDLELETTLEIIEDGLRAEAATVYLESDPNSGICSNGSCSDTGAINMESVPNPKTTSSSCIGTQHLESDPNPELSMNGSGIKIETVNLDLGADPEDVNLQSDPNCKIIESEVVILKPDPSSGIYSNGPCVEPETAIVGSDSNLEICTDDLCFKTETDKLESEPTLEISEDGSCAETGTANSEADPKPKVCNDGLCVETDNVKLELEPKPEISRSFLCVESETPPLGSEPSPVTCTEVLCVEIQTVKLELDSSPSGSFVKSEAVNLEPMSNAEICEKEAVDLGLNQEGPGTDSKEVGVQGMENADEELLVALPVSEEKDQSLHLPVDSTKADSGSPKDHEGNSIESVELPDSRYDEEFPVLARIATKRKMQFKRSTWTPKHSASLGSNIDGLNLDTPPLESRLIKNCEPVLKSEAKVVSDGDHTVESGFANCGLKSSSPDLPEEPGNSPSSVSSHCKQLTSRDPVDNGDALPLGGASSEKPDASAASQESSESRVVPDSDTGSFSSVTPESSDGVPVALSGDGHMGVDTVAGPRRMPFFMVKVPKHFDSEIMAKINLAKSQLEERTQSRDCIGAAKKSRKDSRGESFEKLNAARAGKREAHDALAAKNKELTHVQSLIRQIEYTTAFGRYGEEISSMEHRIEHETMPLTEEKQLLKDIKKLKASRESARAKAEPGLTVQDALKQRKQLEEQIELLKEEIDELRGLVRQAENNVKAVEKLHHDMSEDMGQIHKQYAAADEARQQAYINLTNLRNQERSMNKEFFKYKEDFHIAQKYDLAKDREALQKFCYNQVERLMHLWNKDDEFRKRYIKANERSTARRFKTLDGRSLGPDEKAVVLPKPIDNANPRVSSLAPNAALPLQKDEPCLTSQNMNDMTSIEVINEKKVLGKAKGKKAKDGDSFEAVATDIVPERSEREEDASEREKRRLKEEEEEARIAEELRKEEEAAKLREQRRLEEIAKAKEAEERKKRKAGKDKARAEAKAQKEAEEKAKKKEKRRKKSSAHERAMASKDNNNEEESSPSSSSSVVLETSPCQDPERNEDQATTKPKRQPVKPVAKEVKSKPLVYPPFRKSKRRMPKWLWSILALVLSLIIGALAFDVPLSILPF
ncbi:hypothetical protein AMTRI_Chr03g138180 [Amborella trichopoda]